MNDLDIRYANVPPIGGGEHQPEELPPTPTEPEKLTDAQQQHVNSLLAEERRKAEERGRKAAEEEAKKSAEKAAKEREEAVRKSLKEQGEFRTLNDKLTDENARLVAENERMSKLLEDYEADVEAEYTAFLAEAPSTVLIFKPDDHASTTEKRAYVAKARQMMAEMDLPFGPIPGAGPTPPPAGGPQNTDSQTQEARVIGRASVYSKRI